jgi:PadR family transcriptional regulator PadR
VAKEKRDLLQGTLDMLVLKALQLEPMHGWVSPNESSFGERACCSWARARAIRRSISSNVKASFGLSETSPKTIGARYYSLTREGRRHFSDERSRWRRMSRAINLVLEASLE